MRVLILVRGERRRVLISASLVLCDECARLDFGEVRAIAQIRRGVKRLAD